MGFRLVLEVGNGDLLRIIRPDGLIAGKSLVNFENIYSGCDGHFDKKSLEFQWFSKLESLAKTDISIIKNVIYGGDWDYSEQEYERFKLCASYNPFKSEQEFQEYIRHLDDIWKPIDYLIAVIQDLLRILPEMGENTYWFSSNDIQMEFQALLNTLLLAQERGGEKVRIKSD